MRLKAPRPLKVPSPRGRIVTFYSYKGGTGRSMALANVAWLLAMNGQRVLMIDWDLEAPGLHRYFHPFLQDKELLSTEGLLDFVENLAAHSATSSESEADQAVDLIDYIQPLEWPIHPKVNIRWPTSPRPGEPAQQFGPRGRIDLLPAGRQGPAYSRKLAKFNWVDFYEKLGGRRLLDAARQQMQSIYDYVLIDSRTGVSDTSGICTAEMPDTLVICFTLNQQSIAGASAVASSVAAVRSTANAGGSSDSTRAAQHIRILPVPTRVEITSERDKLRVGLELARQTFSPFLDIPTSSQSRYWGGIQMAYFPFYAFEEIPAVFGDSPDQLLSLSTSIKQLTAAITNNEIADYPSLAKDETEAESIRREIVGWYLRSSSSTGADAAWLAQEIYERLPDDEREPTLSVLARLVQIGEGHVLSGRSALTEDFGDLHKLLAPYLQAKLVGTTDGAARTLVFVEPVIIEKWKTLRDWIEENRQFLILRQTLVTVMQSWRLAERDPSLFLRRRSLEEAKTWIHRRPADFSDEEHQFIEASKEEERKNTEADKRFPSAARPFSRRLAVALVAATVVLVCSYEVWAYVQRARVAEEARTSAILDGVRSTANEDPLTAILLLLELKNQEPPEIVRTAAADIAEKLFPVCHLASNEVGVAVRFSPDGRRLAVFSRRGIEVRDATTLRVIRTLNIVTNYIASAYWSSVVIGNKRGDDLVTLDGISETVSVVDVATGIDRVSFDVSIHNCAGTRPGPGSEGPSMPLDARVSPNGRAILVNYDRGEIGMFRVDSRRCVDYYAQPLIARPGAAKDFERLLFNEDTTFVVSLVNGAAKLLDVGTWTGNVGNAYPLELKIAPPWVLKDAIVSALDCSGSRLLIDSTLDPRSILLNLADGHLVYLAIPHYINSATFDCKGRLAVASGEPPESTLWSIDGHPIAKFPHASLVVFNPNGAQLATRGSNGLDLWVLNRKAPPKNATFNDLMSYFRENTRACLSAQNRTKYLNEVSLVAEQNAAVCESGLRQASSP